MLVLVWMIVALGGGVLGFWLLGKANRWIAALALAACAAGLAFSFGGLDDFRRYRIITIAADDMGERASYLRPTPPCADSEDYWTGRASPTTGNLSILTARPECRAPLKRAMADYLLVSAGFLGAAGLLLGFIVAAGLGPLHRIRAALFGAAQPPVKG
jgi:hypothetical protein